MITHHICVAILMVLAVTTVALPGLKEDAKMTTPADLPEPKDSQVRDARPRTWNKPYHGTPSAQCRRNAGTGPLPPSLEHVTHLTELANLVGDSNDLPASISTVPPRQSHDRAYLNNNLLAGFHYTCPRGGAMSQVFMWGVVYMPRRRNIQMVPWHNIVGFTGTRLAMSTGNWASSWLSIWCVPQDKLECWYTAYGYTKGTLNQARDGITIDLVTSLADHRFAPTVLENCVEIGTGRIGTRGASCIVEEVNIHVEGPIG